MKKLLALGLSIVFLSGCEFSIYPPRFLNEMLTTRTDSGYYERKVRGLVNQLVRQMKAKNKSKITKKVAVMDLADRNGQIPLLGRYLSMKIVHNISKNKYFKLAQRGDLVNAMDRLDGDFDSFDLSLSRELGNVLKIEAIITGKIIDIGTNLDVNLTSIDVKTGEIIASATGVLARTNFAMEMLGKF